MSEAKIDQILKKSAKLTFPKPPSQPKLNVPNPSPFDPSHGTDVPIAHTEDIKFRLIPEHVRTPMTPVKIPEPAVPREKLS